MCRTERKKIRKKFQSSANFATINYLIFRVPYKCSKSFDSTVGLGDRSIQVYICLIQVGLLCNVAVVDV